MLGGYHEQLNEIFYLVKIKNSKDIFGSSKCKVTFGFLKVYIQLKWVKFSLTKIFPFIKTVSIRKQFNR